MYICIYSCSKIRGRSRSPEATTANWGIISMDLAWLGQDWVQIPHIISLSGFLIVNPLIASILIFSNQMERSVFVFLYINKTNLTKPGMGKHLLWQKMRTKSRKNQDHSIRNRFIPNYGLIQPAHNRKEQKKETKLLVIFKNRSKMLV